MPEYLAPGVFIEETSFRAKTIEGVSTTTTGFVGPTRYGPVDIEPEIITSLVEFERTYGGKEKLQFGNASDTSVEDVHNFMWHAVNAFYQEGGKRLYVSRVYSPPAGSPVADGCAKASVGGSSGLTVRARFPGRAGDARVTFTFNLGQNVLIDTDAGGAGKAGVSALRHRDVVLVLERGSPDLVAVGFMLALRDAHSGAWTFSSNGAASGSPVTPLEALDPHRHEIRVVTLAVAVDPFAAGALSYNERELPLDPLHQRGDTPDSVFDAFATHVRNPGQPGAKVISNLARARTVPIVLENTGTLASGLQVLEALLQHDDSLHSPPGGVRTALEGLNPQASARSLTLLVSGGSDGVRPQAQAYKGTVDSVSDLKTGLHQFEDLEDISIVAAPGSTYGYESEAYGLQSRTIVRELIAHATSMRYRIAVIDSGDNQSIGQVRAMRAQLDSTYGALYYPWIRVLDPLTQQEIHMPPSGFVAGIYARNDINRAVFKAPANEVVNLALGFERFLNKSQQEVLNPEGINCFRFFEGRGMRLWGARTISSDPEWKYVNMRRYFAYVERSIDKGTQWAVFEPNGEALWAKVTSTIRDFLFNEFQSGALLGAKPEQAFFVKCDRSTMTQNDLDNGRLICLIGMAVLTPAEFVIFRIGQWTADHKV